MSATDLEVSAQLRRKELAMFSQGLVVVMATLFSGFYILQKLRNRCANAVIYVSTVTTLVYSASILAGESFIWVTTSSGKMIPLGRYFSWLLTCPVIIIQLIQLHGCVGKKISHNQLSLVIILDNIVIVFGAQGAFAAGPEKWIFFIIALSSGMTLFTQVYLLTRDNLKNFPDEAKSLVIAWTTLYFLSWGINPLVWVLGNPGLQYLDRETDIFITSFMDIFSKLIFGISGWYIRWVYLSGARDSKGKLIKSKFHGDLTKNPRKVGLTQEDYHEALDKVYTVLLLDNDILIIKVMQLMMKSIGVDLHVASNVTIAKATMSLLPANQFDAVIVIPNNHQAKHLRELRDFSEYICQAPYKIPMLGAYFDLATRNQEPGYYIHGIIPRPLDELCFRDTLLEWRLTAALWRKVAQSVEALEGPQLGNQSTKPSTPGQDRGERQTVDRTQATMDRKTGSLFANQIMARAQRENASSFEPQAAPSPPAQPVFLHGQNNHPQMQEPTTPRVVQAHQATPPPTAETSQPTKETEKAPTQPHFYFP